MKVAAPCFVNRAVHPQLVIGAIPDEMKLQEPLSHVNLLEGVAVHIEFHSCVIQMLVSFSECIFK